MCSHVDVFVYNHSCLGASVHTCVGVENEVFRGGFFPCQSTLVKECCVRVQLDSPLAGCI